MSESKPIQCKLRAANVPEEVVLSQKTLTRGCAKCSSAMEAELTNMAKAQIQNEDSTKLVRGKEKIKPELVVEHAEKINVALSKEAIMS
ncbi:hypothetical protein AMTR_s00084p00049410 [Amborella trichopoda]|uniref:Uncharacterized protein n=1 Tax=Amborella trichopoda TaxID=13333 RepID=W1NXF2_AMBTC|nr:hypothetical protein AMTR_s00084p00049410 [Amborella trichopoda]